MKKKIPLLIGALCAQAVVFGQAPTNEQLFEMLKATQKQVAEL